MLDYAPVLSDEDEEEQRRRQSEYPPVDAGGAPADFGGAVYSSETPVQVSNDTDSGIEPTRIPNGTKLEPIPMGLTGAKMDTSSPLPADIMPPAMRTVSAGGPGNDLTAVAPPPAPRMPSASPGARPQRSDYQPAELHGWKKGLGAVFTGMAAMGGPQSGEQAYNKIFVAPRERAENDYQAATSAYDKDGAQRLSLQREGREAQTAASEGKLRDAQIEAIQHPQPKQGTPEESTLHDLMTGDNGNPRINPDTNKPYSYIEAFKATKEAGQEAKPAPGLKTERTVRIIKGVPHEVLINSETGEDIKDLGQTKVPGESGDQKRSAAESVQVEREARAAVHKAEQDYNSALATVQMQQQLLKDAKSGNKEAIRIVPLEGALQITTSQGVHRINKTEVEQYGEAGSLYDRIAGAIGGGVSGKNIPDNVLADMDAMTQELGKNAHERYRREYDYNKHVVEGYGGKDFDKRVPFVEHQVSGGGGGGGQGKAPAVGTVENGYRFKGGNPSDQKNWEKVEKPK